MIKVYVPNGTAESSVIKCAKISFLFCTSHTVCWLLTARGRPKLRQGSRCQIEGLLAISKLTLKVLGQNRLGACDNSGEKTGLVKGC